MDIQSSRNIPRTGLAEGGKFARKRAAERNREGGGAKYLEFLKTGRQAVIAIKLNVVEGRSDAEPAWHGCRLCAANARHRDQDDISQAQGFTDEDHFKFNRSSGGQGLRRKEVNAGRTDVPSHEGDGMFLRHAADTAEPEGQLEGGSGIFPLLRMCAHGMRWDANETARLVRTQERRQT
jgi:hypothetical protein